jgi:predicted Zn-dependent peptidase
MIYSRMSNALTAMIGLIVPIDDSVQEKRRGIAHLSEHMIARVLRNELRGESSARFERAWTTFDGMQFTCSATREATPTVLQSFRLLLEKPATTFTVSDFLSEKEAAAEEMAGLDSDISIRIGRQAIQDLFGQIHPYGVGDPGGISNQAGQVRFEEVRDYLTSKLDKANITILIVGDIGDQEYIFDLIEKYLEG